jgi:putative photosynthetic complex assembly protein 2
VAVLLVQGALNPTLPDGLRTGQWLVATLLMLAIIEHWLLVLPLESTALWRWALARSDAAANKEALLHAR